MSFPMRIALVYETPLIVHGVRALLRGTGIELVDLPDNLVYSPGVRAALVDPAGYGDRAAALVEEVKTELRVDQLFFFTWDVDMTDAEALRMGASGVLLKASPHCQLAFELQHSVVTGGSQRRPRTAPEAAGPRSMGLHVHTPRLSARELQMLSLIGSGLTNEQISAELFITLNTVKSYIRGAYKKLGIHSRTQAVAWAMRHGLRDQHR